MTAFGVGDSHSWPLLPLLSSSGPALKDTLPALPMLSTVTSGLCGFGRWDDGGQSVGHGSHCGGIRFPRWALEAGHRERSIRGRSIHTSGSDSKVPIRWGKLKVPIPLGTTQSTHTLGTAQSTHASGESSKYSFLWARNLSPVTGQYRSRTLLGHCHSIHDSGEFTAGS